MLRKSLGNPQPQIFTEVKKIDNREILLIHHGPGLTFKRTCLGFSCKKCPL